MTPSLVMGPDVIKTESWVARSRMPPTFEKDAASDPHAFGPVFGWSTAPETGEVFQNRAH